MADILAELALQLFSERLISRRGLVRCVGGPDNVWTSPGQCFTQDFSFGGVKNFWGVFEEKFF